QIARSMRGREAFQEVDYRAMFGDLAKWAVEIDEATRVPEIVARAMHTALAGRPGPVVVALPEDMLVERAPAATIRRPVVPRPPAADPADIAAAAEMLADARRPLILIGGGGWDDPHTTPAPRAALDRLAEEAARAAIPLAVTFRCQDLVDNAAPVYVGDAGVGMSPHIKRMIREADVLLALNIRFGENTNDGYTLLDAPEPSQRLIHVHPSDGELGKIYQPALGCHAGPAAFASALATAPLGAPDGREAWLAEGRAAFLAGLDLPPQPAGLDMGAVMAVLRDRLPADAILTNGAGNFAIWPSRLFLYGPGHRLIAPQSGAMGYGLPAAVAAKIRHPGRAVVCFAGDGDIQMTMQELGTAMQAGAQPVVLVVNNGSYGTIRMHQERHYPARVSGTEIVNPDYPAIGRAYGMHAERIDRTESFAEAFERALVSPTGALLELVQPTEALTPRQTLSQMRNAALAAT
ncbi:MAG: thiamine pyrophosphate-dependent enzyme, partial [Pseudomonadota bacterium]